MHQQLKGKRKDRTSSSKGASGMRRLPFTPPLFLMAVRTSSSVSSLRISRFAVANIVNT